MTRTRFTATSLALAAFLIATASCTIRTPTFGDYGGGQGEAFRVVYSVRCSHCRVFYTAGRDREQVEVEGSWSRTVHIRDWSTRSVQLTASPVGTPGYIQHAYIDVDGKKVAEERRTSSGTFNGDVTLNAPLVKGG